MLLLTLIPKDGMTRKDAAEAQNGDGSRSSTQHTGMAATGSDQGSVIATTEDYA